MNVRGYTRILIKRGCEWRERARERGGGFLFFPGESTRVRAQGWRRIKGEREQGGKCTSSSCPTLHRSSSFYIFLFELNSLLIIRSTASSLNSSLELRPGFRGARPLGSRYGDRLFIRLTTSEKICNFKRGAPVCPLIKNPFAEQRIISTLSCRRDPYENTIISLRKYWISPARTCISHVVLSFTSTVEQKDPNSPGELLIFVSPLETFYKCTRCIEQVEWIFVNINFNRRVKRKIRINIRTR